jgi:molecular chaperone DnaJ
MVTLEQVLTGHDQVLNFNTHSGNHTINIKIPAGVDNGDQMRYDNLIPDATLIVEFRIQHDPKFERRGLDLYSNVDISVLDLITGTVIDFDSLSGKKFQITVPAKSQPNSTLRVAKEGLSKNSSKGDQYLLLKPYMPAIIDDEIVQMILRTRNQ